MRAMNNIILQNVSKSYGDNEVIRDFSLALGMGERLCIMGESGCGKTTLLNIILGLTTADSGDVSVSGRCACVFQEDRLCESFSAVYNVKAVTGDKVSQSDIEKCLSELGLSESLYVPVSKLSGGMRRRVAIARALLAEAEIIILDEAFKGLDENTRKQTIEYVLSKTTGKTLICATHDKKEAEMLSAQIINI